MLPGKLPNSTLLWVSDVYYTKVTNATSQCLLYSEEAKGYKDTIKTNKSVIFLTHTGKPGMMRS